MQANSLFAANARWPAIGGYFLKYYKVQTWRVFSEPVTHVCYPLCIGNYSVNDLGGLNDIQACVSKDSRSGFEGHDVVEVSWETHSTHGMYMCAHLVS